MTCAKQWLRRASDANLPEEEPGPISPSRPTQMEMLARTAIWLCLVGNWLKIPLQDSLRSEIRLAEVTVAGMDGKICNMH